MKVLFWTGHTNHISVLLDEAVCLCKEGHDVYFLYNKCSLGICSANMWHDSTFCKVCNARLQNGLSQLPRNITRLNIKKYWEETEHKFVYNSVDDIRKIEYKHVKIGKAILSSYISCTRNLYPLIDDKSRGYFDRLLTASCRLTDALERVIEDIHPDRICYWNTRYFDSRPIYDLATKKGIESVAFDRTNNVGQRNCKTRFINTTPHDVLYRKSECDAVWDNAPLLEEEKVRIGKDFFVKRRNGIATNDKVYVSGQKQGMLPKGWDDNKRNVVIFNSSEDEFAAIGEDFEEMAFFPTQYRGIKYIAEKLSIEKDVHIYLRIHPNLAKIPYRYHIELLKLGEQYPNLTVIPAAESISTYALMDAAEKVIVFGSTMGIESAYWGKPVIQLAGAWYYYSDLCYTPKTAEELDRLLYAKLQPKDNFEAIKWGFYFMYRNPNDYAKYIDIDKNFFGFGKHRWEEIRCFKIFGSSKLFAWYTRLLVRYYRKNATYYDVPLEEDKSAKL